MSKYTQKKIVFFNNHYLFEILNKTT